MVGLGVVEDLAIEDYITSHSLKNCLLNKLKQVYNKRDKGREKSRKDLEFGSLHCTNSIIDTHCKYAIAHGIIDEFRLNLVNKIMLIWHDHRRTLLNCTDDKCNGEENVCCRKRKIKLALIERMSAWLKDKDNLRYLHDGEACNCAEQYSREQLDYHKEFITRLVETGTIDFSRCNSVTDETACDSSQDSELSEETDSSLWCSLKDITASDYSPHGLSENTICDNSQPGQSIKYKHVNVAMSNLLDNL